MNIVQPVIAAELEIFGYTCSNCSNKTAKKPSFIKSKNVSKKYFEVVTMNLQTGETGYYYHAFKSCEKGKLKVVYEEI